MPQGLTLRILDRYLIRQTVLPFVVSLVLLTFVLQIQPLILRGETLIAQGASASMVAALLLTLVPQALAITIPMSLLIALLMALGRLSSDREIVALQACGVSVVQLLRPVAVMAVVAGLGTLYVNVVAVPAANQAFQRLSLEVVSSWTQGQIRPHVFFRDFPGFVLYVGDEAAGHGWHDVFAANTSDPARLLVYRAERGDVRVDAPSRTVQLILTDGEWARVNSEEPETFEPTKFQQTVLALNPDQVFPNARALKGAPESTIAELREEIQGLDADLQTCLDDPSRDEAGCLRAFSSHNLIIAIHNKFAIPVACLVFALVALSLGSTTRKEGKFASFVLGIGVVYAYYFVMSMGESLAKGHQIPPPLAAWLANIVLGLAAIGLFARKASGVERPFGIRLPIPWRRRSAGSSDPAAPDSGEGTVAAPAGDRVMLVLRVPELTFPGPSILDRYVMRICARSVLLSAAILLGLFYLATFIDLSDKLFKGETTVAMIVRLLWFSTPQYLYFVIPIAVLLGTLVTIGAITKNSELVVMKACGISLYRTALPLLALALAASAVLFLLEERVLARSNRQADVLNDVVRGRSPRSLDALNRRWLVGRDRSVYHYVYFDRDVNQLVNVSIYEFDRESGELARITFAARALYEGEGASGGVENRSSLEGPGGLGVWEGSDGWVRQTLPTVGFTRFDTRPLRIESPDYFGSEEPDADLMSYSDLREYVGTLESGGFNVQPYLVSLHRKLAFPFITIVMTLIAVPFAVTTGRRGALYGIGAGIVLALVYWMAISTLAAIGAAGLVSPLLAAWAPNVLFATLALYLLFTVRT